MTRRSPAAHWVVLVLSAAAPLSCGGLAEGEASGAHPVEDPQTDGSATSGGTSNNEPLAPGTDPSHGVCGCPADEEMYVLVFDAQGAQNRFAGAPPPELAPGDRVCGPLDRPSAFRAGCAGSGSFALGACNLEGACVELGFTDDLMVLNLWRPDRNAVQAVASRNWKFETNAQAGVVSGTFLLADHSGGAFQGAFSVCDLMESSARFAADAACAD